MSASAIMSQNAHFGIVPGENPCRDLANTSDPSAYGDVFTTTLSRNPSSRFFDTGFQKSNDSSTSRITRMYFANREPPVSDCG